MGISGREYDRFAGPDYTPNKDRRMAEWRKKKDAERKSELERKGAEEASRAAEAEDKPEVKEVVSQPITSKDTTLLDAINSGVPGETLKKPTRRKKPTILNPSLFDEVN